MAALPHFWKIPAVQQSTPKPSYNLVERAPEAVGDNGWAGHQSGSSSDNGISVVTVQIFRLIRKAARTGYWHYQAGRIFEQRQRESVLNDLQGE